jgi:sec-independent protein translocase protein TatA
MILASFLNLLRGPDVLIIALIGLIMFGGKNLPGLARSVGEAIREFTKAKND